MRIGLRTPRPFGRPSPILSGSRWTRFSRRLAAPVAQSEDKFELGSSRIRGRNVWNWGSFQHCALASERYGQSADSRRSSPAVAGHASVGRLAAPAAQSEDRSPSEMPVLVCVFHRLARRRPKLITPTKGTHFLVPRELASYCKPRCASGIDNVYVCFPQLGAALPKSVHSVWGAFIIFGRGLISVSNTHVAI